MSRRDARNNSGIVRKDDASARERLSELTREARSTFVPTEVDWKAVEARLFERIERETADERPRFSRSARWVTAGAALAVAAAALLVWGRRHDGAPPVLTAIPSSSIASPRAALEAEAARSPGRSLEVGATLTARDRAATFEREGEVVWMLEPGTVATVKHARGPLVLALVEGAIEAQVEPVPSGEAFAVDVGTSRVAVHGTHLRVARAGEQVIVDLTEGEVAIGVAPSSGPTVGEVVRAPAHVEFDAGDVVRTLRIDRRPTAVRAPVDLGHSVTVMQPPAPPSAHAPLAVQAPPAAKIEASAARPSASSAPPDPHAEATIVAAVRACLADRPQAEGVSITVESTLDLTLNPDGSVQLARFNPALPGEVQACAAPVIYKTRFARTGTVSIPISFQR